VGGQQVRDFEHLDRMGSRDSGQTVPPWIHTM
jgi:hypothetical protein